MNKRIRGLWRYLIIDGGVKNYWGRYGKIEMIFLEYRSG